MSTDTVTIYPYRWVVLAAFGTIAAMTQVVWITFAPITVLASRFYGESDLLISLLALSFIVMYIIFAVPAAWMIDTWGFKAAVIFGSVLTVIGALGRGIFPGSFVAVLTFQIVSAIGQPFVVGATTKLAARWFPVEERATAAGLGILSSYLGALLGMIITPELALRFGIPRMLLAYGLAGAAAALVFVALGREAPPTPPCRAEEATRTLMFQGLKSMMKQRDFLILLLIFFIGLGLFNGISIWVEAIVRPRGFSVSQAGMLGGIMLAGGVVGSFVIPMISDSLRRRKAFLILSFCCLMPGLIGVTFATSYWLLLVSGFEFGFFMLSAGPIGFQYAAEITHPAPEGTSNSILMAIGQFSAIVFIFGMDAFRSPDGSMTASLLAMLALCAVGLVASILLRESPIRQARPKEAVAPAPVAPNR